MKGPFLIWLSVLAVIIATGCAGQRFEYAEHKMGTSFRIVLYAPDQHTANKAARAAYHRIDQLNAILSDYDPESELSRLSRRSTESAPTDPVVVSNELFEVLSASQSYAQLTNGAFDVTVGPMVKLWRRSRRQEALPSEQRLETARAAVGYRHLRLDAEQRTVRLMVPNMRIDLGGIGKGYALDQVLLELHRFGIRRALIDGGGDIAVGAAPPGRTGWCLAIHDLDGQTDQSVTLSYAAIATSGDTQRFVEVEAVRYSHIIDPATGLGLRQRIGASVIGPSGTSADALASALCVLGAERGLALAESLPGIEARIVTRNKGRTEVRETPRFGVDRRPQTKAMDQRAPALDRRPDRVRNRPMPHL